MQSFDDEALFACLNVEKKYKTLQEESENKVSLEQNGSDLGKYFKQSLLLSDFMNENNDKDESKLSLPSNSRKGTEETNQTSLSKYFEDNVTFHKVNNEKNSSSTSNVSRYIQKIQKKVISSQKNKGSHRVSKRKINTTNSKRKCSPTVLSIVKEDNEPNIQHQKIKFHNDKQTAISNSAIRSPAANCTYDKENSNVILSLPLCTQDRCKLASWGLPPNILKKYIARGVEYMFAWQMECLSNQQVMQERQNLVYSAPTSAGKTLVAEILLIKNVLEKQKKVIFILPFVSVVREKMYYLQDLLSDSGIRVEGFMGGTVPPGGFAATNVAIATIEKANSLVNRLMEENDLSSLGAVIIDELHLLGDANRGYLLELLLTKLKYMTIRNDDINIQLIGMSATLPNLPLLAKWLNAELYKTEFRPIPLNEYCKIGANIYDNKLNLVRKLEKLPELEADVDDILQLCIETISAGHSVLIFCSTKKWCEKLAEQLAKAFYTLGCGNTTFGKILRKEINSELIQETLEQLKRSPSGLDNILKKTISFGIAFHHAGLTLDERDIIEGSFRTGSLRVLIATSTLSSGVNLPARRVIIRSPMFGCNLLNTLTYKQMIGRAGRMGKDSAGESILICKPNERNATSLLSATLDPIKSCLNDSTLLTRALLEAVASEVLYTSEDLQLYINCTLLSKNKESDVQTFANEAIKFLLDNEFLLLQTTERKSRWVATPLGKACLAASVPPREGLFLFEELQKARRCFVLDTELHVVYLVTPLTSGSQIGNVDWMTFHELWNIMSESQRRVGKLVGVEDCFLMSAIKGIIKPGKSLNIHKRFYSALALHDLVNEVPLNTVCKKYGCCRGVLQTLQQSSATYAGMVTQFCKQLQWDCMELLVSQFQTRLQFGVCRELLDLLRLPMLNGLRARNLYKQGITCVTDLAVSNELNVERALYNALPFESEKEYEGEYAFEAAKRNKMRTVFVTGRDGLTPQQAAILLVQEARILVQRELGLEHLPWEQNEESLQINTHVGEDKDMSDNKSRTQTDLCADNMQSAEARMSNIENSIHNKFTDKQTRENDGANVSTRKVTDEAVDVSKEKNSIDSNDQHLKEATSPKNSENEISFLEISSPDIIVNDECLNNKKKRNCTKIKLYDNKKEKDCTIIGNSTKIKRDIENLNRSGTDNDGVPNKKLKFFSSSKVKYVVEDQVDKNVSASILYGDAQLSHSRSPSLFGDSLNLDTQMCDILEQNVLDLPILEDSEIIVNKSNTLQKRSVKPSGSSNLRKCNKKKISLQSKSNVLSWDNDSWRDSKELPMEMIENKEQHVKMEPCKDKIKDIANTSAYVTSENTKICVRNTKENLCNDVKDVKKRSAATVKEKIPRKSKLLEVMAVASPVPNVVVFRSERKISVDSNRSDSDDIIVDSQLFESPFGNSRIRTQLDKIRKMRSQKNPEDTKEITNCTNSPMAKVIGSNDTVKNSAKQKVKSKLKEISSQNFSKFGNVIYDSEDEEATDTTKPVSENKRYETRSHFSNESTKTKVEVVLRSDEDMDRINVTMTDWNTLNIVKVADNKATFNLFKREVLKKQNIALALHCDTYVDNANSIGSKICISTNVKVKRKIKKSDNCTYRNKVIRGVAISWESNIAYYISFNNLQESKVSSKEQMALLKELLYDTTLYVNCFATKDTYKLLYQCCGISAKCRFLDPMVAHWLYTNGCEKSYSEMVNLYFPEGNFIMKRTNSHCYVGPGMDVHSTLSGEFRSAAEAVLTWHMTENVTSKLEELNSVLLHTFREVETRIVTILACMELSGIGVNIKSLQDLSTVIINKMQSLETRAYDLAGRKFNLSSSKEVGQVLGLYKDKKISTSKAILEKCDHPISPLVILWRKLSATKTKFIYPLLNLSQGDSRIHGNCITSTVTGRVSMQEPNLQNVPKDFIFEDNNLTVSVRMAFVPALSNVILSADYCQLELRILTHFSQDSVLCQIMRQQGDIFKSIAAKWNDVTETEVTNEMRQRTKQLCYGMIYGMGVKSLAENLCVSESEAQEFLESFMSTYPGIYKWLNEVLEKAHHDGYVVTLLGRRRQLPDLKSTKSSTRAQAERQAVNTKVQGSAADIVKKAMISIEDRMRHIFPDSAMIFPSEVRPNRKLRSNSRDILQRGGYLVLQLHDELLYEVNSADVKEVAALIKESMENICQLSVPLPVKVRVGPAWGNLTDYQF